MKIGKGVIIAGLEKDHLRRAGDASLSLLLYYPSKSLTKTTKFLTDAIFEENGGSIDLNALTVGNLTPFFSIVVFYLRPYMCLLSFGPLAWEDSKDGKPRNNFLNTTSGCVSKDKFYSKHMFLIIDFCVFFITCLYFQMFR